MRGEYTHIIDAKGRLFVPAKFREELGTRFVITKGLSRCLSIYPLGEWDQFEAKINALPTKQARTLQLFFVASAQDCELDAQGRFLVPQKLREYAGLEKNTVVVGMTNHIEVWDESEWNAMELTPENIAAIMEEAGI